MKYKQALQIWTLTASEGDIQQVESNPAPYFVSVGGGCGRLAVSQTDQSKTEDLDRTATKYFLDSLNGT